jgi:protein-S-isoprenylcysteine O-methyltransferase Ste14
MRRGLGALAAVRLAFTFGGFGLVIFWPAGNWAWREGWIFLGLFVAFATALTAWLWRYNPSLLEERLTGVGRRDQKGWDKVVLTVAGVLFFAWLALCAWDGGRRRLSPVPPGLSALGVGFLLVSFAVFFLTFRENTFLSPAVRIQSERGHAVVSTGPYRFVRHPLYAAFVVFVAGTECLFGSWRGLWLGFPLIATIALRAVFEERVLGAELPGYTEYRNRVRFRLIPGIW